MRPEVHEQRNKGKCDKKQRRRRLRRENRKQHCPVPENLTFNQHWLKAIVAESARSNLTTASRLWMDHGQNADKRNPRQRNNDSNITFLQ